jgi:hypothetical protein
MDYRNMQGGIVNRGAATRVEVDQGLRSYMLNVYNWMALGLALTGAVAFAVTNVDALAALFYETVRTSRGLATRLTILGWVTLFAPLALVFFMSFRIHAMRASTAQALFWFYAALMGASLAPVIAVYTGTSVAKVFFISAATFGAMSLYGYTTKADLTKFGSFLIMGLIGVILASIVNLFLQSSALSFAISILGLLIFVGLTAYDTQKIKESYDVSDDGEIAAKKSIMGALTLYLDFINIFLILLQFLGIRREE